MTLMLALSVALLIVVLALAVLVLVAGRQFDRLLERYREATLENVRLRSALEVVLADELDTLEELLSEVDGAGA